MLKKYLITSREFYTDTPAVFKTILHQQFVKHIPDFALYRDKQNPNYALLAEQFVDVCHQFENIKAIIHGDVELAVRLQAFGVHLTSEQFDKITQAKELGLQVIVSTHSKEELLRAEKLGADYATYSPIFATPNKGEPKGIEDLQEAVEATSLKIFALGGIVDAKEIAEVEKTSAYGFASIRYFYN